MTHSVLLRLAIGLGLMAVSCSIAFRYGDRTIRFAAGIGAVCWLGTTGIEMLIGPRAEVVLGGNAIAAVGLLVLAALNPNGWLWLMTALEAVLFMVHAWFYGAADQPASALVVLNNALATANLVVLVIAAIRCRLLAHTADLAEVRQPTGEQA